VKPITQHERNILRQLELVLDVSDEQLLRIHLLPWVVSAAENKFALVKKALLDWLFMNSKSPGEVWADYLRDQQIIPLSIRDAAGLTRYGRLADLVAPDSSDAILYLNHEAVFPDDQFYTRHRQALTACGIGHGFAAGTVLDRAEAYSKFNGPIAILKDKVEYLLRLSLLESVVLSVESLHKIRSLSWIPGISIEGADVLLPPNACRGPQEHALVDHVWGTTSSFVGSDFEKILGQSS